MRAERARGAADMDARPMRQALTAMRAEQVDLARLDGSRSLARLWPPGQPRVYDVTLDHLQPPGLPAEKAPGARWGSRGNRCPNSTRGRLPDGAVHVPGRLHPRVDGSPDQEPA